MKIFSKKFFYIVMIIVELSFFFLAIRSGNYQYMFISFFIILNMLLIAISVGKIFKFIGDKILEHHIKKSKLKKMKVTNWLNSNEPGMPSELLRKLEWYKLSFAKDKDLVSRVQFLKEKIHEEFKDPKDIKNCIDYLEMKDKSVFLAYFIPIFLSFSGISVGLELIPNMYDYLYKLFELYTKLASLFSIIFLAEIILIVILIFYSIISLSTIENRFSKRLLILFKSVYEEKK